MEATRSTSSKTSAHAVVASMDANACASSSALEPAISRALQINRQLQERLRRTLAACDPALAVAESQQGFLEAELEKLPRKRLPNRTSSFFADRTKPRSTPIANSDAAARAIFREKHLSSLDCGAWTVDEGNKLLEAMVAQLREEVFHQEYMDAILKAGSFMEKKNMFQELSLAVQEWNLLDLWRIRKCRTDWSRISLMLEKMGVFREPRSCFLHFIFVMDPRINKGAWTKDEDKALLRAVAKHQGHNWETVAQELATNRTAYQCFARYQQRLNPELIRSDWGVQEDERLQEIVGMASTSCGNVIQAQFGDGRTSNQLQERIHVQLQPDTQHGFWSEFESRKLAVATLIYGRGSWAKVSRHVPNRTAQQCQLRYERIILPEIKRQEVMEERRAMKENGTEYRKIGKSKRLKWTSSEDRRLIAAVEKYGAGNWSRINKDFPGRIRDECSERFLKLNPEGKGEKHRMLVATRRKMFPNRTRHFIHHPERVCGGPSELCAADFNLQLNSATANNISEPLNDTLEPEKKKVKRSQKSAKVKRSRKSAKVNDESATVTDERLEELVSEELEAYTKCIDPKLQGRLVKSIQAAIKTQSKREGRKKLARNPEHDDQESNDVPAAASGSQGVTEFQRKLAAETARLSPTKVERRNFLVRLPEPPAPKRKMLKNRCGILRKSQAQLVMKRASGVGRPTPASASCKSHAATTALSDNSSALKRQRTSSSDSDPASASCKSHAPTTALSDNSSALKRQKTSEAEDWLEDSAKSDSDPASASCKSHAATTALSDHSSALKRQKTSEAEGQLEDSAKSDSDCNMSLEDSAKSDSDPAPASCKSHAATTALSNNSFALKRQKTSEAEGQLEDSAKSDSDCHMSVDCSASSTMSLPSDDTRSAGSLAGSAHEEDSNDEGFSGQSLEKMKRTPSTEVPSDEPSPLSLLPTSPSPQRV